MGGTNERRRWWVAAVLSLLCTGLGHAYCGRLGRGLLFLLVSLAFVPIASLAAWAEPSKGLLIALLAATVAVPVLWLLAVGDSIWLAIRGSPAKSYSRPAFYVLYLAFGLLLPAGLTLLVRDAVLEAYVCPTRSMAPAIQPGDRILVNKIRYLISDVDRWDVVVFRNPEDRSRNFIKRIVGLPGDRVEIRGDRLILNGKEIPLRLEEDRGESPPPEGAGPVWLEGEGEETHRISLGPRGVSPAGFPEVTVPEDAYFLLGDARNNSQDSRGFGFVPREDVVGAPWFLFLPGRQGNAGGVRSWSRFGVIPGAGR